MRAAAIALDAVMRVPKKAPPKSKPSKPDIGSSNETVTIQDEDRVEVAKSRPWPKSPSGLELNPPLVQPGETSLFR